MAAGVGRLRKRKRKRAGGKVVMPEYAGTDAFDAY